VLYFVYTIHVLVCIFLILVVLLQQGKGADLSVFGGGSTQTAFGAVGATSLLHKLTVGSFVLFILTTMTIAVSQSSSQKDRTVLSETAAEQTVDEGEEGPAQEAAAEETAGETGTPAAEAASPSEIGAAAESTADQPGQEGETPPAGEGGPDR